jgi:hypothetical protein
MARFMLAHLDRGRLGDARILSEETALRMQAQLHRHAPGIPGMAHGFIEGERGGRRVIGHGGDTLWFHTHLELYPAERIGIFASFNTAEAAPQKLAAALADRYFGAPDGARSTSPAADARGLDRLAGSYRSVRYAHDDLTKLGALFSLIDVRDAGDGTLRLSTTGDDRWLQVEPLLFREEGGDGSLAFREDGGGAITHLFLGEIPVFAFERVPLLETVAVQGVLLAAALGLFLATLLIAGAGTLARMRYGAPAGRRRARLPFTARWLLWLACLVFVVFFAGLVVLGDPLQVVFGMTPALRALLALPVVGGVLAALCVLCLLWVWARRHGGLVARLAYTLVVAGLVVVCWQLALWRLLALP